MNLEDFNNQRIRDKLLPLKVKDNTGGGDCLFLSILDAGLGKMYPDLTVNVMRNAISEWCEKNETLYLRTMKETVICVYNSFWNDSEPNYKEFIHKIKIPGTWHTFNTHFIINVITDIYDIMITIISNVPNSTPINIYRFGKNTRKILEEDIIFIGHIAEFHYVALIEDQKIKIRIVNPNTNEKKEYPSYEEMLEDKQRLENRYIELQHKIDISRNIALKDFIFERNDIGYFLRNMNFIIIKRDKKDPEEVIKVITKLMENEKLNAKKIMYKITYLQMLNQFTEYESLIQGE
jgi:hypothetical protein